MRILVSWLLVTLNLHSCSWDVALSHGATESSSPVEGVVVTGPELPPEILSGGENTLRIFPPPRASALG